MAERLGISYGTFRWHKTNILKKVNAHSIRQIIPDIAMDGDTNLSTFKITPRGHQVLAYYAKGKTIPYIANALGISISGVRRHLENLREKNDCATNFELLYEFELWNKGRQNKESCNGD